MADDVIGSFLAGYGQEPTKDTSIPPRCCCGNDTCVHLGYHRTAIDGLKNDAHQAAKLGQVSGCDKSRESRIRVDSAALPAVAEQ